MVKGPLLKESQWTKNTMETWGEEVKLGWELGMEARIVAPCDASSYNP